MERTQALNVSFTLSPYDVALMVEGWFLNTQKKIFYSLLHKEYKKGASEQLDVMCQWMKCRIPLPCVPDDKLSICPSSSVALGAAI